MCLVSETLNVNCLSHFEQEYFIPSCFDCLCVVRFPCCVALYPQRSQGNFCFIWTDFLCAVRLPLLSTFKTKKFTLVYSIWFSFLLYKFNLLDLGILNPFEQPKRSFNLCSLHSTIARLEQCSRGAHLAGAAARRACTGQCGNTVTLHRVVT